jgi:long-chain acyl-CoA synthetase
MDATPYLELRPAPRALFDAPERRDRTRYMVPEGAGWRAVTFGQVADEVRDIALFLASDGHRAPFRGAVFAHNRVEWMSAALGIQTAGMVPIYPASTAEQAAYVASHSDARVVFVDTPAPRPHLRSVGVLRRGRPHRHARRRARRRRGARGPAREGARVPDDARRRGAVLRWSEARARGAARDQESPGAFEALLHAVDYDAPGMMLYTSGTSGNPKGVPLSHRNVGSNTMDWLRNNAPLLPEAGVDVLWLPMSHIFGFGEMGLGNLLGFTTYMSDPAKVLAQLPS